MVGPGHSPPQNIAHTCWPDFAGLVGPALLLSLSLTVLLLLLAVVSPAACLKTTTLSPWIRHPEWDRVMLVPAFFCVGVAGCAENHTKKERKKERKIERKQKKRKIN